MPGAKLTFFGGVGTATGANILLECGSERILVDCGLLQGPGDTEEKNFEPFPFDPASIGFLLVTHAHLDHIGRVPKLVREGFNGKIISTQETKELARLILEDSLRVMGVKFSDKTLFNETDLEKAFSLWEGRKYGEKIELRNGCALEMQDAGHILGSAILNVSTSSPALPLAKGKGENLITISFTGDLGNSPAPLLPDTEIPKGADYIVVESVYGDRNHESKRERREKLKKTILEGIKRGGTIVIPVFSIERTQVLLYELNNMIEDKEIPEAPVFLDSPLALKVTEVYRKYQGDFKEAVKKEIKEGDDIFNFPGLKIVRTAEESEGIQNIPGPKIVLAGSGMSEGGRVVSHEMNILGDEKNTLILVGYQALGTLGRRLEEGANKITLPEGTRMYDKGGQIKQTIRVKAKVETIKGYSSHKDSEHLVEFVEKSAPRKVFVIMGEPKSSLFLCQRIREYLNIEAVYPEEGREYEL